MRIAFGFRGAQEIAATDLEGHGSPMKASRFLVFLAFTLASARAQSYAIFTFDAPGAALTTVQGINDAGEMVGRLEDATGAHAFLRRANGTFVTVDAPGAKSGTTTAMAVNNLGQITGIFQDESGLHAYVRAADAAFTAFDIPTWNASFNVAGINDNGDIVGTASAFGGFAGGFLRRTDGTIVNFTVPGATQTFASGINNRGQIVGTYLNGGSYSVQHGYLRDTNGSYTTIDMTGLAWGQAGTRLNGINNAGQMIGDLSTYGISVLRDATGAFFPISGLAQFSATSIDDNGRIAGTVFDDHYHGVLAVPIASGKGPAIRSALGVASATAFGGDRTIAPGTWIEIYGSNLANTTRSWTAADFVGDTAPTSLDGVRVTVGGLPAFLSYVSPNQVNAQIPAGITPGQTPVTLILDGQRSNSISVPVENINPGVLGMPSESLDGGIAITVPGGPVRAGDTISFFAIGCGQVVPDVPPGRITSGLHVLEGVAVEFNDLPAKVVWAGLSPGSVGLYQINVEVPSGLVPEGSEQISSMVVIRVNGIAGPRVFLTVQR